MTPVAAVPVELQTVPQPAYAVAAPDRVFVQVIVAPKPAPENYGIQPGDVLSVEVFPAAQQPAIFTAPTLLVAPDGKIRIAHYGELKVAGNNLDQIAEQIKTLLREHPDIQALAPRVNLQLAYLHDPLDLLTGDRLIRPDGTVNLSPYGDLFVQGMTLPQVREAVRKQILQERPDLVPRLASSDEMYIDVEVTGFNSQVCYVQEEITQPSLQPITGTETVLDVVVRSGSATELAERNDVYLVRVNPFEGQEPQILPVHLRDIIRCGDTSTNYQLRPGDRIVVPPRDVVVAQRFLAPFFQIADSMASTGLLWERLIGNFRVDTTQER
jgi:protein involved in polysaccharide export with SLBB domain